MGPCLPPPLPRVLAGVELPAGGLLLGLWAAKLALCVHSCEPGAGRTVVETIRRLGRPEQGSTALVLVRIQMVPVFAKNLPALSPCCPLSLPHPSSFQCPGRVRSCAHSRNNSCSHDREALQLVQALALCPPYEGGWQSVLPTAGQVRKA